MRIRIVAGAGALVLLSFVDAQAARPRLTEEGFSRHCAETCAASPLVERVRRPSKRRSVKPKPMTKPGLARIVSPSGRVAYVAPSARPSSHVASVNRDCLHHSARSVLDNLESRFGKVTLVSTCRPGARMPNGDVSWHARNRAFDFVVPKGIDKRDVMVWLGRNSPGVTMSYRNTDHIHTDAGSFHKVIYNAASHTAGERAVAIWRERASAAVALADPPLLPPRPAETAQPFVLAALGDDALRESTEDSPSQPQDRRDIFRRYIESKDVVVRPWVRIEGVDGRLVRLVNDAATHFGRTATINSGYRSPAHNRKVGGARNSQHMQGRAVDFRVAGVSPWQLRGWVVANPNRWGIRGLGTYGSHVHADVRKATKLVTWTGGTKKRVRYAKHRKPSRYASAG